MICDYCKCSVCYCNLRSEAELEGWFCAYVHCLGGKAYKLTDEHAKGFPDRTVILDGNVGFIEFKKPDGSGKLSPHQEERIEALGALGALVRVAETTEECLQFLKLLRFPYGA